METLTNSTPLSDPPAASPRWVLLEQYVNNKDNDPSVPVAKATAASCTSSGQSFSISFALVAPPAISRYYCDWISGAPGDGNTKPKNLEIIAAHDDCALIEISGFSRYANRYDYFLHEAGAGRAPLLSLLPSCYDARKFFKAKTILLRRGVGELLVAQLEMTRPHEMAELCVLRPSGEFWVIMRLPIVHPNGGKLPQWLSIDTGVPVGVLPRVAPQYPMVSSDKPDIVCFMLCEDQHFIESHYLMDDVDATVWLLEIDTRSKALLSVVRRDNNVSLNHCFPAKLCW